MPYPEHMAMLPLWYVVFLLSVTFHEAGHAWAAYRGGDRTAYLGGQVSLNPVPHVRREPFGTVLVPLLSFFLLHGRWMIGWASAPYDPRWEDRYPRRAAWMAAAGPAANLLLAAAAAVVLRLGVVYEVWRPALTEYYEYDRLVEPLASGSSLVEAGGRFCSVLLTLNVVLFLFNLIPLPPMDGASVVAGFVPGARPLRDLLRANALAAFVGLVVAWKLFPLVFRPVYLPIVHWIHG